MSGEPTDWRADAACVGMPLSVFFVETGANLTRARKVCASCPVELDCLQFALSENIKHGFFGGKSERERRTLRRRLRKGLT